VTCNSPLDLSIVIPSHNRPELLRRCLATVCRHAPEHTEIVVVDDGSADGSASAVAAAFPRVQALRLPRRRGFCVSANRGIEASRGAVVELLNDDTEVCSGWATAALADFVDPAIGAVAPLVLCWPGDRIDSAGDRYYLGGIAGKRYHGESLAGSRLRRCPVFGASASSAFYRREALRRVGLFPEDFAAYFEDVDLSFRLHRAGYHILFEPDAQVLHHVSASYGRPRRRLLEQQAQNEERVFWRNLPAPALVRALPSHLAVVAAKAWRRWQEGGLAPFLFGRLRTLGDVPQLVRHRRQLDRFTSCADLDRWDVEPEFWHGSSPLREFRS
jgi:GT2 family glycosyltransferase